ncbi:MAG: tetratricopeptide repeat protein [Candidatus Nealsonbacteria bacterium]|nr:tetratricopeptide repeat protein [Candidatus Nealsonbacteria bacterium]
MTKKNKTGRKRRKRTAVQSASKAPDVGGRRRFPRLRKWGARLLAVVLAPTLFLAVFELVLWLFGYGYDTSYFIKAEKGDAYLSNPKFSQPYFGPKLARTPIQTVISADKPDNTYRVFVFGGSAAQGVPDPAFSFSRILEAMLNDRYPQTRFEVIDTAAVAINSHVVLPVVKQCGDFEGDLYVVYLGNNEVVGPYGAGTIFESPSTSLTLIRASIYVGSTRLGQLIGNTIRAIDGEDPEARKEWGGMGMFLEHRVAADDPKLDAVYDNFTANLEDICAEGRTAGLPVIVSTVLTNLKDCPPLHSTHREDLSTVDRDRWEKLYRDAVALQESGEYDRAAERYAAAEKIDNRFAELHFRLAQCRMAQKRFEPARRHFVRARDLDTLRFRADSRINRIIRAVADKRDAEGVYLVDLERVPQEIPGSELLYEHVHLNFAGNYLVASEIFEKMATFLPASIRKQAKEGIRAPSLSRCEELTLYTDYNRLVAAVKIAEITMDPPFPDDLARRSIAEAERLEAKLTPEVLAEIARKYDRAVGLRPDDLLLRLVWASLQSVRNEHASAAGQYRELIERYPLCLKWHHQLGTVLARQGKTDEAVAKFRWVLEQNPYDVEAYINLGSSLAKLDQLDLAIEQYGKALSIRPKDPTAHYELGRVLLRDGQPQQAEEHLAAAIEAAPTAPRYHFYLGRALIGQNKLDQALKAFQEEVAVFPRNPLAQLELGNVFLARKQPGGVEKAIDHYSRALDLNGNLVPALNNLAWLSATHPLGHLRNGNRAVRLAERACQLIEPPPAALLDTLAAAYAEVGQFDRAVETAEKAVALAEQASKGAAADPIRARLDLYRQQKPFRDVAP